MGPALKQASLPGYHETVKRKKPYEIFRPLEVDGSEDLSFETIRVRFVELDKEVPLDAVVWKKDRVTDQEAVFSVQINLPDGKPLARVIKTYTLKPQPGNAGPASQTHDLGLTASIENLSGGKLQAVLVQQGPLGMTQEAQREDRSVIGAMYEQGRQQANIVAKSHARSKFAGKSKSLQIAQDDESHRVAWIAEANQYFTCIMAPEGRTGMTSPEMFERVDAVHLTPASTDNSADLSFRFITRPMTIAAGEQKTLGFDCYVGPKSKKIFESVPKYEKLDYYAVITSSFYMCAPAGLVGLMMWLLNAFYRIPPHNYGIAIFLLVVVVRGILHPITKRSQVNMMKMQKQMASLQPKLKAAKEKYANDKAALNQATMEVYRDAGINPAGNILTCIPMMLQLPIWAALWAALSSTVEMRHAPLDGWWIKDLTRPDALFTWTTPITIPLLSSLMGGAMTSLNLLPILLGISQMLQAKYMPKSNAPSNPDNPDQMDQQRKMMMFMSIFFFFMFYNMPSGLNLYIMSSNVFGIAEQWRIRKHIEEEEKKGKLAPAQGPKRKTWLQRKWEELQKEAEEAKRISSERAKKRK